MYHFFSASLKADKDIFTLPTIQKEIDVRNLILLLYLFKNG